MKYRTIIIIIIIILTWYNVLQNRRLLLLGTTDLLHCHSTKSGIGEPAAERGRRHRNWKSARDREEELKESCKYMKWPVSRKYGKPESKRYGDVCKCVYHLWRRRKKVPVSYFFLLLRPPHDASMRICMLVRASMCLTFFLFVFLLAAHHWMTCLKGDFCLGTALSMSHFNESPEPPRSSSFYVRCTLFCRSIVVHKTVNVWCRVCHVSSIASN